MGDGSKIEWCDATWNPLIGCTKASAGCDNCYAIRVVHRGLAAQHRGLTVVPEGTTTPEWTGEVRYVPALLDQPLRWTRPRLVFVNSLSDLFHPEVASSFIEDVFAVMALAPRHTFQLLTKRPKRMALLLGSPAFEELVREAIGRVGRPADRVALDRWVWPLPNVWAGTSVEDNRTVWRANALRELDPGWTPWVSAEPMIGPLDRLDLTGIAWMVAGGESGPLYPSRQLAPSWVRDLRDRCVAAAVPFHFKQWGVWLPDGQEPGGVPVTTLMRPGRVTLDARFDRREELMFHGVDKSKAGRELDGRTWDEWPTSTAAVALRG